jgi:PTS system cellobiose-specific IIB component
MVSKMNIAAMKMGASVKIRAVPENSFKEYEKETDILLLGPQVSYTLGRMKSEYEPKGIKVSVINSMDYGMMDGEKVLKAALNL